MSNIRQKIIDLVTRANFWRAAIFYGITLGIGGLGFFIIGGTAGWYMLTCFPGFGSGVAIALLNNGDKKPVTKKSVISTFLMTALITVVVWYVSGEPYPALLGWGLGLVGSALTIKFLQWESNKVVTHLATAQYKDSGEDLSPSNKS